MSRLPLAACIVIVSALGCRAAPPDDPVLLDLGGEVVRRSDFERHLQGVEARSGSVDPAVRQALLESFVEERALVLEARAEELVAPGASAEEERAAVQRLLGERVLAGLAVSEAEVDAYYREHAEELAQPESVTLRQVLVTTENEARDVLRRLARDPKSFERLARTRSRGPEAEHGGQLGSFVRGELPPELEAAAFSLSAGRTSGVLHSPFGYHVLQVEARQPARQRSLEECRAEIHERLLRAKSEQATHAYVQALLARAKVDYEAAASTDRRS